MSLAQVFREAAGTGEQAEANEGGKKDRLEATASARSSSARRGGTMAANFLKVRRGGSLGQWLQEPHTYSDLLGA